ncbi:hypothetical protein GCM10027280_00420 [Micromonospora polyrhachis]|uniref:Uncharacterized protein n=1 Tax=Micromonospora polyrhachis TaxID=1282883 RepID=A0A7W7WNI5_9ACTN|nr:hypothetical protein [Micromonospora polyrhachis]MBB4957662.1 hypothetical protein [Micromonospora polyrhachis]
MAATGWKNAFYGLLLLGGLVVLVVVPGVVSCALPNEGRPLTERLDIGYGATIQPPAGSRLDVTDSRPGSGEVVLLVDGVEVRLSAQSFRGDGEPYAAHARDKFQRDQGLQLLGRPEPLRTTSGVTGERGSLVAEDEYAVSDNGCYAILTAGSVGVVALVTPVTNCAVLPTSVSDALASIEIEGAA